MNRTRAFLTVAALFLLGVLVGVLATHAFYAYRVARPGGLADLALTVLAADFERSLDLDDAQKRELDLILVDVRTDMTDMRTEMLRRIRESRSRSFARVAAILRPDQLEELEAFRLRQNERLGRLVGEPVDAAPLAKEPTRAPAQEPASN